MLPKPATLALAALSLTLTTASGQAGEAECSAVRAAYQTLARQPAYRIVATLTANNQRWEDIHIGDIRYSKRGGSGWQKSEAAPGARENALHGMKYSECTAEGRQQLAGSTALIYSFVVALPGSAQPNPPGRVWVDAQTGRILRFEGHAIRMEYHYSNIKPPISLTNGSPAPLPA